MHSPRRRTRERSRVLYWFRTPPGVRVGRAAIDEEAIRLMEEHHPEVDFDWPQILKGDQEAAAPVPSRAVREAPRARPLPPPPPAAPVVSASVPPEEPINPAHARFGSEGLARLRARYADVMAGISRRVTDAERREQLKGVAERLNPDTWVTDAEVSAGLEEYETVLASLTDVVGRRRRRGRSRPGGGGAPGEGGEPGAPQADEGPDDAGDGKNGPETDPLPEN